MAENKYTSVSSPENMKAFGTSVYGLEDGGARPQLFDSINKQSTKRSPYDSPIGRMLMERRNRERTTALTNKKDFWSKARGSTPFEGGASFPGGKIAYVPSPSEVGGIKNDAVRDFHNNLGFGGVANHELEHAHGQPIGMPNDAKQREYGTSIGDLVFRAEQFQQEEGKPLDHTVRFPGGSSHNIQWMQEQAKKHGYWDGRPMTNLLFDTQEGQAWLRSKMPGRYGNREDQPALGYVPFTPAEAENFQASAPQVAPPERNLAVQGPQVSGANVSMAQPAFASQASQSLGRRVFHPGTPVSPADLTQGRRDMMTPGLPPTTSQPAAPRQTAGQSTPPVQRQSGGALSQPRKTLRQQIMQPSAQSLYDAGQKDIAAMKNYVDGQVASTQNRNPNELIGIQTGGGNLPSSPTQMAFAGRAEQRGRRGDLMRQTVMNPTQYNGINVSNQAVVANRMMAEQDPQFLSQNGFEVTGDGVMRRASPMRTGGGTFGAAEGDLEGSQIDPASVAAARERYGLAQDGTGQMPSGRLGAIMARTDLDENEKQRFVDQEVARRIMDGESTRMMSNDRSRELAVSQQLGEEDQRARRLAIVRARQNQAAQQQQGMLLATLARQAMMGNPQAMQMMEGMQEQQRDAMKMGMRQQEMGMQAFQNQQEMGLRQQEMLQRGEMARQQMGFQAAEAERDDNYKTMVQGHQQKMEQMQAEAIAAQREADAELNPIRKEELQAKADLATTAAETAAFQLEQANKDAGVSDGDLQTKKIADSLVADGVPPSQANVMAQAESSRQELWKKGESDPQANALRFMPEASEQAVSAGGAVYVQDTMDRINQMLNYVPDPSRMMDGTGEAVSLDNIRMALQSQQVNPVMVNQYVNSVIGGLPNRLGSSRIQRAVPGSQLPPGALTPDEAYAQGQIPSESVYARIKQADLASRAYGGPGIIFMPTDLDAPGSIARGRFVGGGPKF